MNKKLVSIATTAFNEEPHLKLFYEKVKDVFSSLPYEFEIIVAENGSVDNSLEILRELHGFDRRVRFVSLSRNFGHQGGLLAALSKCRGELIITLDADLQHPIDLIPTMIGEWEKGFKVVITSKEVGHQSYFRRTADNLFYKIMKKVMGIEIGQSDFRLLDRVVLNRLLELPESEKFLRGLVSWLGFKQTSIKYKQNKREFGDTKFLRRELFDLALQGVTSFSSAPLRLLMKFGFLVFIPSFLFLIYTSIIGVINLYFGAVYRLPPGWATLLTVVTLFGSLQILAIGLVGEYVGRIYVESKKRPLFIVEESADG